MSHPIGTDQRDAHNRSNGLAVAHDEHHVNELVPDTTRITDDGRVDIDFDSQFGKTLTKLVGPTLDIWDTPSSSRPPSYRSNEPWKTSLNIVIQVVGSRGDVQPFIALGTELQQHGHRIRIATHENFKDFVEKAGLEFYAIGGDPVELMAYMVKNPGLIPHLSTIRQGGISKKRRMIREMIEGCWRSCSAPDPVTQTPFVANAIIANPVSFAHVHCAQALAIPVHIMFTMPWSPTRAFPHPLANIKNLNVDSALANYLSYAMVQSLTWQGLADVINDWRRTIGLEAIPMTEGPFLSETLQIPHTYCWSPALIPKPRDWPRHIDVCGFFFRHPQLYTPSPQLASFLAAGPPPIYIGFGSIVVDNPTVVTEVIIGAVKSCKVRAIISAGWSKIGQNTPVQDVFFLNHDCPHDWLFQHVSAVIHHGGAGTTACGLLNGRPTTVIPFFGDQPFWGDMVAAAGAGPHPIPARNLNVDNLSEAISFCLTKEAASAAADMSQRMASEKGVEQAVNSFHAQLSSETMACDILPQFAAVWVYRKFLGRKRIKLSTLAAHILIEHGLIKQRRLERYEATPKEIVHRRIEPVTALYSTLFGVTFDVLDAANSVWKAPYDIHRRAKQSPTSNDSSGRRTVAMIHASAMSIPRMGGVFFKWMLVDMTLAVTEGFRAVPKLYGEQVPDNEFITGFKSGGIVAGKHFARNLTSSYHGLATQPAEGLRENGVTGLASNIGKGALGAVTKTTSACLGLYSYTAQGVYKSLHSALHSKVSKTLVQAQKAQDKHTLSQMRGIESYTDHVLSAFEAFFA